MVHFPALKLGVGVAADDEIIVWKLPSQLHINIKAHMGQQHVDVALLRQPSILRYHLLGLLERQPLHIVWTGVGDAQGAHLGDAEHTDLNALDIKDLVGRHPYPSLGRATDVGRKIREIGQRDHPGKALDLGVILMVAQGRRVKADQVHHRDHGIGHRLIEVIIRVARAVIPGRQDQQERVDRPQAIDNRSKLRHLLDRRVHIIGRQDSHRLAMGDTRHRGQHHGDY